MTWNTCPLHAALPESRSASTVMRMAFKVSRISAGPRLGAQPMVRWPADIISEAEFRDAPKMNWVKALLLLSCLIVECADLVTTNVILDHGWTELNPFMRLAQTWLGEWWLIPKLSLAFVVIWLLSRSNNLYNISRVALCSTPAPNNLIIIAGMGFAPSHFASYGNWRAEATKRPQ